MHQDVKYWLNAEGILDSTVYKQCGAPHLDYYVASCRWIKSLAGLSFFFVCFATFSIILASGF